MNFSPGELVRDKDNHEKVGKFCYAEPHCLRCENRGWVWNHRTIEEMSCPMCQGTPPAFAHVEWLRECDWDRTKECEQAWGFVPLDSLEKAC
jgi:hypothetical protein